LKLNGTHQRSVYVHGVNVLEGRAPDSCSFGIRLQQNATVNGLYDMEDFNVIPNNRYFGLFEFITNVVN